MKIFLTVPFAEKDQVKALGAKWDATKKSWFANITPDNREQFKKWLPEEVVYDPVEFAKIPAPANTVLIYADGACKGNPGRGGWGAIIRNVDGSIIEIFDGVKVATNNQMELTAVIKALDKIPRSYVLLRTDSKYVCQGWDEWLTEWRMNDWQTSKGEDVKNKELWIDLERAVARHVRVIFQWVRGHDGDMGNERADELANKGVAKV